MCKLKSTHSPKKKKKEKKRYSHHTPQSQRAIMFGVGKTRGYLTLYVAMFSWALI